jgi:hypothetical protein
MKDFFIKSLPYLYVAVLLIIVLTLVCCFQSAPVKDDFDIPESFDKATCSHYSKDRKLFGTSTHNVLECQNESTSLMDARKEQRAYKRIKMCKGYKAEGFETKRECLLYINQK